MQLPFFHTGTKLGRGVPRVNWQHPITEGLLAAYVPGAFFQGPFINLAAPGYGDLVTRTGVAKLSMTPDGLGFDCSPAAAANSVASTNTPTRFQLASGMSAFIRGKWVGYSGTNVPFNLFGIEYNAAPFWAWGIFAGPNTGNGSVVNSIAYTIDIGSTTFTSDYGAAASPGNGNMFDAAFIGTPSLPTNPLYQNGIFQTNPSPPNAMNANHYGSLSPVIALGDPTSTRSGGSILTVAYMWNRLLSLPEITALHENPYMLLLWPEDSLMAEIVGAPPFVPPPPALSRQFLLSPLTIGGASLEWLGRRKMKLRRYD